MSCRNALLAVMGLWISLLAACTHLLPSLAGRAPSTFMTDTATVQLSSAIPAQVEASGLSGIFALAAPLEAFAARVLLMRAAERSLDIQYYIWHGDITGQLMLGEVLRAAERGVRVRLLLDDNGIAGLDADLAALGAHPGVEVRLFNPFVQRSFKAWGYVTDFERLNHRMHNKSLTADALATIVGGRNVGDAYFGADSQMNFSDLDVLALGPAAKEVSNSFDAYWNSTLAYPATAIIGAANSEALATLKQRLTALRDSPEATRYASEILRSDFSTRLLGKQLPLDWVPVRLMYDPPAKALQQAADTDLLLPRLMASMGPATRAIDLVSPYFVPGDEGTQALTQAAEKGIKLRIVTNSLAATDVAAVHAGYAKRRKALLRAGVTLYELKADATPTSGAGLPLAASSGASLHGKTFVLDRERVFVGSMNFDQRSIRINTEMGLVIESTALAKKLSETLDKALRTVAYEVRLTPQDTLEWIEQTPAGEVRYSTEPKASLSRRIKARAISWLPIDGLL